MISRAVDDIIYYTKVTVSGGFPLDLAWQQQGDILTGQFTGDCGEAYLGDYR